MAVARKRKRDSSKAQITQKTKRRLAKDFFPTKYRFKFDWDPYVDFDGPSFDQCEQVFNILKDHHAKEGIEISLDPDALAMELALDGPMHAGEGITFDALVKTIMAQATNNVNAIVAHRSLVEAYPYAVDGEWKTGTVPNYHAMRAGSQSRLEEALRPAGLSNIRAKAIKECLNMVHAENVADKSPTQIAEAEAMSASSDFVPGMLSLDYLMHLSKEDLFARLVGFPLIGVKTAACILAFNFKMPVFAVDTHVMRLSRLLKWLPEECHDRDLACAHLDFHVPSELKYGLHQAFWHHGQRCKKCMSKSTEKSKGWEETVCPLEEYVNRSISPARKVGGMKRKRSEAEDSAGAKPKQADKTNKTHRQMTAEKAADLDTSPSRL